MATSNFDVTANPGSGTVGGSLELLARFGASYGPQSRDSLAWWLYGGIPTPDRIAGIELDYVWNGDVDPSLIVTSKLPQYNLFPDPRAMSASNPWRKPPASSPQAYVTNGEGLTAGFAELATSTYEALIMGGGGALFGSADANAWDFIDESSVADPAKRQGASVWECKMALPADMKKALAAGDTVPLSVGWYTAGSGSGLNSDSAFLYFLDSAGNQLGVLEWIYDSIDLSLAWAFHSLTVDAIPLDTASIGVVVQWQIKNGDAGDTITRKICFPMVTNSLDATYRDGDTDGWIWTSTMNNSPSRESDLTVSTAVLEEVKEASGGRGLFTACLYDTNSPEGAPGVVSAWWTSPTRKSGSFSGGGGCVAMGLAIQLNQECPYTITLQHPPQGSDPAPYGLTINSYTMYATGTEPFSEDALGAKAAEPPSPPRVGDQIETPAGTLTVRRLLAADKVAAAKTAPQAPVAKSTKRKRTKLPDWVQAAHDAGFEDPQPATAPVGEPRPAPSMLPMPK